MNRFSSFLSAALVALWLLPQTMLADDCQFTPNLFPGQAADRTALEVNASVKVGEWGACTTHMYSQISALTSSNPSVVQVYNQGGYDAVFAVGVGTADVTYTENWYMGGAEGGGEGGTSLCPSYHTIHYTVAKGTPQAYAADPEKGDPVTAYTTSSTDFKLPEIMILIKTYTAATASSYPQMRQTNMGGNTSEITLNSSNLDVVEVGRGNTLTYKGLGKTTITATWAGNDNWNGATVSYELTVEQGKLPVTISFRNNLVSDTVGKTIPAQAPIVYPNVSPITWSSNQPSVASIDASTGEITTLTRGQAWIRARFAGNETYAEAENSYCLTVIGKDPKLSFAQPFAAAEVGVPTVPQTLTNPFSRPVVWSSSDPSIAEIASDGSVITPKKTGDVEIYASIADPDDPVYFYVQASYTLQVRTIGISVLGVNITSVNAADVLGDGKVTFDVDERTLHLYNWNVNVRDSSAAITNGVICEEECQMTNMLHGNCSIIGAERCIYAPSAGVVIRSESKKDTVTLRADASDGAIAIIAQGLKMHEALFFATGKQAAFQGVYLSITKWGHVFAEALYENGGEALRCQDFQKGEGGIGGIDILTPDVEWRGEEGAPKGFFSKSGGKAVRLVEIGKVPMPINNDVQTTIEFSVTDPEGHDYIVFSNSASDVFNAETNQIEVTSTFSDEQVTAALESLVPGSSAWVLGLPGSIIFDIPAGEGSVELDMTMEPGYEWKFIIGDATAVSITPNDKGIAVMHYNVLVQTHVILYLQYKGGSSPAPKRAAKANKDAAPNGALKSITITPKGVPTGIDQTPFPAGEGRGEASKLLINGQLLILRDGRIFNAQGQQLQ